MSATIDRFRARGFGLVELMVALGIVAILSGLGAVGVGAITGRTRVTAAGSELLHAIELARAESIKRAARVTIAPLNGHWTTGWTVFIDSNANRRMDTGEPLLLHRSPLSASTRVLTDTTPGYIAFGGRGIPQQYSGAFLAATVTLCDSGIGQSIVLAKSGRPRLTAISC